MNAEAFQGTGFRNTDSQSVTAMILPYYVIPE